MKLEYEFPEGFDPVGKDLVQKLLVSTRYMEAYWQLTALDYSH